MRRGEERGEDEWKTTGLERRREENRREEVERGEKTRGEGGTELEGGEEIRLEVQIYLPIGTSRSITATLLLLQSMLMGGLIYSDYHE